MAVEHSHQQPKKRKKRGQRRNQDDDEEDEERDESLLTANTLRESNGQAEQGPSIKELSTIGKIWSHHHQSLYGK